MAGLYLFYESLTDDGAGCLFLSEETNATSLYKEFSFSEIRELQESCPLIVVINSAHARFHLLEMPLLQEKKARTAIPFALEEQLSKSMDNYHFAFSRAFYQQGHYLVVSMEKAWLWQCLERLTKENIHCNQITLDWFALNENESALTSKGLLVYQPDFKGSLSRELSQIFIEKQPLSPLYCFSDSTDWALPCSKKESDTATAWIGKRLDEKNWINIAQGEFKQGDKVIQLKKWLLLTSGLVCIWAILWLGASLYKIHYLNKELENTDQQIAKIYRQYYPGAKKVINPKFRLSQLFQSNKSSQRQQLWFIMTHLSQTLQTHHIKVQRFVYQNNQLSLTLLSPDFNQLEAFEQTLESKGIKVKQTQAGNTKEGIIATLELS